MTEYKRPETRPDGGKLFGFDHLHFCVSNAKQAAVYYSIRFGFQPYAYKGLETGSREIATHVVKQGSILLAFSSYLLPNSNNEISKQIGITGDVVKDIAFSVQDSKALYQKAIKRGAKSILSPVEEKDEFGSVIRATVQTYGDTVHSFIQRNDYKGAFLPGYKAIEEIDPISALFSDPGLLYIDHVVGNHADHKMNEICEWYEKTLDFHRFWSVDDSQVHSEYSALRSIVMTDFDRLVKMPMNEPAAGLKKSQIQEYVDYHGGAGVQHVALRTENIIHSVSNLRSRGLDFLSVPKKYYENVKKRLLNAPITVTESIDELEKLNILIDFDDKGYLLQIFTKPVEDRPTLFYEVIQRRNHEGFGAGNFKALFESIERDQAMRGNLESTSSTGAHGKGNGKEKEEEKKEEKEEEKKEEKEKTKAENDEGTKKRKISGSK